MTKPISESLPTKQKNTKHHVRVMDCLEGMKVLSDESVDVVVTSPPYNLGIHYGKYLDVMEQAEYLQWCVSWMRGIRRVLKPHGSLFLNLGSSPTNPTIPHDLVYAIKNDGKFQLQNTIHWIKSITVTDDAGEELSKGHFKPINSARFINDCHEYVFHLTPNGDTPIDRLAVGVEYKHKSNINRWEHSGGNDKRCRGNNWFIPYKTIKSRKTDRPHPATFPIELPEQCIRLHGADDDLVVMDPFLGIGSTWIAALRCRAALFIGFDIDGDYVEMAKRYTKDKELIRPSEDLE